MLENGSWEAYSLAAARFPDATNRAVHVLIPSAGATVSGAITVRPDQGGGRRVEVVIHGLQIEVDLDAEGTSSPRASPRKASKRASKGPPRPRPRRRDRRRRA